MIHIHVPCVAQLNILLHSVSALRRNKKEQGYEEDPRAQSTFFLSVLHSVFTSKAAEVLLVRAHALPVTVQLFFSHTTHCVTSF